VEALPTFLASLGIDQAVVSTLDCIANRALVEEAILPADHDEYVTLRRRLEAMAAAGATLGVPIHTWLTSPKKPAGMRPGDPVKKHKSALTAPQTCTENIQRSAFISAVGEVSPCVYTGLSLTGEVTHWIAGEAAVYTPLVFGNITQQSFAAIWRSPRYRAFRKAHRMGQPPDPCRNCPRLRMHAVTTPTNRCS
jgi:MoaA/NifB/PqqE/SkfB family radical SAM enzyme